MNTMIRDVIYNMAVGMLLAGSVLLLLKYMVPINIQHAVIRLFGDLNTEDAEEIKKDYYLKNPKLENEDITHIEEICLSRFAFGYMSVGTILSYLLSSGKLCVARMLFFMVLFCLIAYVISDCVSRKEFHRKERKAPEQYALKNYTMEELIKGYRSFCKVHRINFSITAMVCLILIVGLLGIAGVLLFFANDYPEYMLAFICVILTVIYVKRYTERPEVREYTKKIDTELNNERYLWLEENGARVIKQSSFSNTDDLINECCNEQKKCDWFCFIRTTRQKIMWNIVIPFVASSLFAMAVHKFSVRSFIIVAVLLGGIIDVGFVALISLLKELPSKYNSYGLMIEDLKDVKSSGSYKL